MDTKKIAFSFSKLALVMGFLTTPVMASSSAGDFPYVQGFKAYAQEMRGDSKVLADAANAYADDVFKTERKVGYIGKTLQIPKAIKVTEGVYTVVGSMIWHTAANFGLNNNLSFIIFEEGVFVFNAGANNALAYTLHQQIKKITDKPVKWLAVENNQGHAYLGASYWADIGVKNLYSSRNANDKFSAEFDNIKAEWALRVGKNITRSARDVTDKFTTFEGKMVIDVGGGETVELIDFGPGHTQASTSMYIPSRKVLFTGDLGFNERMPVFFSYTNTFAWQRSYEAMLEIIPADTIVVPGHGTPTDMATAKHQMYDYLVYMHTEIQKIVDAGGDLEAALNVDQSMYKDRPVFAQAAENNAKHIYDEIKRGDF
jgi:glyoxylase-like metal-dependent hydrolase (beta-lactamase superfamily II)